MIRYKKALALIPLTLLLIAAASCGAFNRQRGEREKMIREKQPVATSQAAAAATTATEAETQSEPDYIPRAELLRCDFFDNESFATWDSGVAAYTADRPVICGVVPHHLTAGNMITGFFKAAADSRSDIETETVVMIATSHYEGGDTFYTTRKDWDTPFGIVKTDTDIVDALCDSLGAKPDDERLVTDHSASAHIPFVKSYFPDAKAACLLVAPERGSDTPQRIAEALASVPNADKCLFVFSIDFSHYLSDIEADKNDAITREAVMTRDYGRVRDFGNDNVDSPLCLSAYMRLSDLLGMDITEADNSNTAKVIGIPYSAAAFADGVTSYFVFITS